MHQSGWLCGGLLLLVAVVGCGGRTQAVVAPGPPEVIVSKPVAREIVDYEDFTGHTEAVADVAVRARVTGYLDKVLFKEGEEVKQGDPLFNIDPRTYQAELLRAEADVLQSQARMRRLQSSYKRAEGLLPAKAISQDDFEVIQGEREASEAAVKLAQATRDLARLNIGFTQVTAPISGRIGHQLIDPGNMVKADDTVLTTIVSQHPIYAYFYVDERTVLKIRRLIRAGVMKSSLEAKMPVLLGLQDEQGFPHEGTVNFVDNRNDAMTGTLRLRGVFPNPERIILPGLFARIRLPIGKSHSALLISEQALGSDQGQKFVYVVNDKNEVVYRQVKVAALQDGGFRAIEDGLAAGERVVVAGLQRIRPGVKVRPKMAAEMAAVSSKGTTVNSQGASAPGRDSQTIR
jgi:RND family efflux transporter MFP subunit